MVSYSIGMVMKKNFLFPIERQEQCRGILLFCALISSIAFGLSESTGPGGSNGQTQRQRLNLNDPQQRKIFIESLRERRRPGRERAEAYLRSTGKPKQWQNGQTFCELMSIEENRQFIVYMTTNANSATSIVADIIRDDPYYGITGNSITAGVWDQGIARPTHQELVGRVTSQDGTTTISNHSTAVTGTMAASGINASAKGMAPSAQIWNYNWTEDETEMAEVAMSDPGQANTIQISNHSYGIICGWYKSGSNPDVWYWYGNLSDEQESFYFGQYNYLARDFDSVCYNAPYFLPFRGAGNDRGDGSRPAEGATYYVNGTTEATFDAATSPYADNYDNGGFDTLMPGACAKNVLTIGAVNDAVTDGVRDLSKATVAYLSAWGPTDDGRVKPDLVTNGVGVYSCSSSNDTSYTSLTGTSLSSPAAAGVGVQLVELYHQLFPGQDMRSSSLKGLMIHAADDIGNPGPDYKYGWGLVNAETATEKILLHERNPTLLNIREDSVTKPRFSNSSDPDVFTFQWDGISPIKATLCWTDPAASTESDIDQTTKKLVNNLEMTIMTPGGATVYPFVLNPYNPDETATTGINNTDNIEQVLIEQPAQKGTYTVEIYLNDAAFISKITQDYSLIISGQAQPAIYDIDGNGEIGLSDFMSLAEHWLTDTPTCDIFPATGDGSVDLLDFSLLSQSWL